MSRFLIVSILLVFFVVPPPPAYCARRLNSNEIIRLINGYRHSQGLRPLKQNARLQQSAQLKANDMARKRYFGHTSPDGVPFEINIERVRYPYTHVGEILARGCGSEKTALDVWVDSPRHREAILDPVFREIGCASAPARNGRCYAACHLGTTAR